jgi:hypothetical protein
MQHKHKHWDLLGACEDVCARAVPAYGVRKCCVRARRESGQRHVCGEAVPGAAGGCRPLVGSPSQRSGHVREVCGVGAWGTGRRGVFPQCWVEHAWTLGLVRCQVTLSGMLLRWPSEAFDGSCVESGYSRETFLTVRALRVARS